MACSNLSLAGNVSASCNNLGGLGPTVWLANWSDIASHVLSASGYVNDINMKPTKRFWKVTTDEFQNHFEAPHQKVGGQTIFNHQLTIMGGAVESNESVNDLKAWEAVIKARKLVAIIELQNTKDTDTHFLILGLDNGLTSKGGDGLTSGTNREDMSSVSVQLSGYSQGLPLNFQSSGTPNLTTDLAMVVALETPAG